MAVAPPSRSSKRREPQATVVELAHIPTQSDILTPSSQTPLTLLPRREESSLRSLMSEDERMDLDEATALVPATAPVVSVVPTIQFLAQQMPPAIASEPSALQAIGRMFSRRLAQLSVGMEDHLARARDLAVGTVTVPSAAAPAAKRAKELKRSRMVAPAGNPIGFYADMELLTEGDEREAARYEHFYTDAGDCFDPDQYFGQDDPSVSPMAAGLSRAHSSEFARRQTVLETTAQDVPHTSAPEELSMLDLRRFRMPPRPGDTRLCPRGEQCLFKSIDSAGQYGYVGREFYAKEPPASDSPVHECIDCTLLRYTTHVDHCLDEGFSPPFPINEFCVSAKEYAHYMLLHVENNGVAPGIVGCVPRWDRKHRHFEPITREDRVMYGLEDAPQTHYLAEINVAPPPWDPDVRTLHTESPPPMP